MTSQDLTQEESEIVCDSGKICSMGLRSGHIHEQQRQNVRRTSTLDMRVKDNCLLSLALTAQATDVVSPSKRYVNVTLWEVDALSR